MELDDDGSSSSSSAAAVIVAPRNDGRDGDVLPLVDEEDSADPAHAYPLPDDDDDEDGGEEEEEDELLESSTSSCAPPSVRDDGDCGEHGDATAATVVEQPQQQGNTTQDAPPPPPEAGEEPSTTKRKKKKKKGSKNNTAGAQSALAVYDVGRVDIMRLRQLRSTHSVPFFDPGGVSIQRQHLRAKYPFFKETMVPPPMDPHSTSSKNCSFVLEPLPQMQIDKNKNSSGSSSKRRNTMMAIEDELHPLRNHHDVGELSSSSAKRPSLIAKRLTSALQALEQWEPSPSSSPSPLQEQQQEQSASAKNLKSSSLSSSALCSHHKAGDGSLQKQSQSSGGATISLYHNAHQRQCKSCHRAAFEEWAAVWRSLITEEAAKREAVLSAERTAAKRMNDQQLLEARDRFSDELEGMVQKKILARDAQRIAHMLRRTQHDEEAQRKELQAALLQEHKALHRAQLRVARETVAAAAARLVREETERLQAAKEKKHLHVFSRKMAIFNAKQVLDVEEDEALARRSRLVAPERAAWCRLQLLFRDGVDAVEFRKDQAWLSRCFNECRELVHEEELRRSIILDDCRGETQLLRTEAARNTKRHDYHVIQRNLTSVLAQEAAVRAQREDTGLRLCRELLLDGAAALLEDTHVAVAAETAHQLGLPLNHKSATNGLLLRGVFLGFVEDSERALLERYYDETVNVLSDMLREGPRMPIECVRAVWHAILLRSSESAAAAAGVSSGSAEDGALSSDGLVAVTSAAATAQGKKHPHDSKERPSPLLLPRNDLATPTSPEDNEDDVYARTGGSVGGDGLVSPTSNGGVVSGGVIMTDLSALNLNNNSGSAAAALRQTPSVDATTASRQQQHGDLGSRLGSRALARSAGGGGAPRTVSASGSALFDHELEGVRALSPPETATDL